MITPQAANEALVAEKSALEARVAELEAQQAQQAEAQAQGAATAAAQLKELAAAVDRADNMERRAAERQEEAQRLERALRDAKEVSLWGFEGYVVPAGDRQLGR